VGLAAINIHPQHLDPRRRRLRVKIKGGRWREQPLTRVIVEALERERSMAADPDGWAFPNSRSKSGHYESMRAPFRRVVIAAGLDPRVVTPHTLRHTAITDMAETGAPIQTVQDFSGHETIEMVMRYIHARDRHVDEAMDRFENERTKVEHLDPSKRESS
jgi:integrase